MSKNGLETSEATEFNTKLPLSFCKDSISSSNSTLEAMQTYLEETCRELLPFFYNLDIPFHQKVSHCKPLVMKGSGI